MGARRGLASLMASLIKMSSEVCGRTRESLQGSAIEQRTRVRRVLEDIAASQRPPETPRRKRILFSPRRTQAARTFDSHRIFSVISVPPWLIFTRVGGPQAHVTPANRRRAKISRWPTRFI